MARLPLIGLALAALALAGCSDVRRSIGLDRQSPDEFSVVSRAPLTLPPSMQDLPKPRPGALRPQDSTPTNVAAGALFGGGGRSAAAAGATTGEKSLIAQAGSRDGIDPGIRAKVDQETTQLIVADKSWIDSLLFWQTQEQPFSIVDPAKEQQRLREAQAQGKPVTGATTPTIERKRKAPLEGLF
ncbi:DUF3035 domain-containing protein [Azospirillum picis]|uniref:DUF3035 domain-containing protein n=1 Tax=Azospirillum picis TaxID=488438 RepID=A0ABU0MF47_9PROT|nr:DUF3035 domain-containing protein [Azospirillum picis]MBP2298223.1 hypothetical protein [Azospirillum picis]MDQ0532061.1 hypothetical protein [Azospirillum picis]